MAFELAAAGLGLGGSLLNNYLDSQKSKKAKQAIEEAANDYTNTAGGILDESDAEHRKLLDQWKTELASADWDNAGKVNFDNDSYDVENYYDPRRNQLVGAAGRTAQAGAALSGMGRSLGAAQGIASAQADVDANLYKDALAQMNTDRNFDYQVAKDSASQQLEALKNKLNSSNSIFSAEQNYLDDKYNNQLGLQNTIFNGKVSGATV